MPSFVLIHPTVWPQYTNVTDKTDRPTDRQDRHNSMWPLPRPTSVLSGILIYPAVWQATDMSLFLGGGCAPFLFGELCPHLTLCSLGRVYLHAMFHFDPLNRLATIHQRYRQTDRTGQRSDSIQRTVFGRQFVKRFALCYQTVVCLSVCLFVCLSCLSVCLSVCDVCVL